MVIVFLKRLLQLSILLALQVFLMNHLHLGGYGAPCVYVALLLYIPVNAHRIATLVWAFVLGLLVDMFSNTPGLSAASMTFAAMWQPGLLHALVPRDSLEDMTPTYRTMGVMNHLRYLTLLLLLHHSVYFILESFSFFNWYDLLLSTGSSFVLSWGVIALLEMWRKHG